jgi:hypothetical protein
MEGETLLAREEGSQRVVALAAEPPLLNSTIGRLLTSKGWQIERLAEAVCSFPLDMVITSPGACWEFADRCTTVVVLPDEAGNSGQVTVGGVPRVVGADLSDPSSVLAFLMPDADVSLHGSSAAPLRSA